MPGWTNHDPSRSASLARAAISLSWPPPSCARATFRREADAGSRPTSSRPRRWTTGSSSTGPARNDDGSASTRSTSIGKRPVVPEPTTCVPASSSRAGEAWQLLRSGQEDPADFGVFGTENWGAGEVRGNAMRDLASLVRKVEMLPWDVWGPMEDSYDGKTGDDFDLLIDQLAVACHSHDEPELERIYDQLSRASRTDLLNQPGAGRRARAGLHRVCVLSGRGSSNDGKYPGRARPRPPDRRRSWASRG